MSGRVYKRLLCVPLAVTLVCGGLGIFGNIWFMGAAASLLMFFVWPMYILLVSYAHDKRKGYVSWGPAMGCTLSITLLPLAAALCYFWLAPVETGEIGEGFAAIMFLFSAIFLTVPPFVVVVAGLAVLRWRFTK